MESGQELAVQTVMGNPVASAPLTVAIERAIEVVESETKALRANPTTDLKPFEYRKSQALLDLTRAKALVPAPAYTDELKAALSDFKSALQENVDLLSLHMNAVSEVVKMMSRTMIDQDSDGTYQAPFPERAR